MLQHCSFLLTAAVKALAPETAAARVTSENFILLDCEAMVDYCCSERSVWIKQCLAGATAALPLSFCVNDPTKEWFSTFVAPQ